MHIPKFRTIIGQKLLNLRNRISPQPVWVKEELSQKSPVVGLKEDVFELGENQEVIHGVIIEKAPFKKPVYSLVPSKQVPYKETFTQSVKEKNPHITNLTNELERVCYNGMEFETLFNEQPHLSRTVGSLPQKWARKIGESKEKRDRVDELFSEFGKEFHSKVKSVDSDVEVSTDNLKEGLSDVLSTDVEIAPLGKGSWGQTYKINVDSQDYVLKVYYNLCPRGYGMREHYHGNFHELSSAVWASKNDADSYAMFYMGKFGEKQDGYMLTKYVPPKEVNGKKYNDMVDLDKKNFVFSNYLHKLHCVDLNAESSNRHGKKIVDFGDTSVSKAGKLDEKTYRLAHTLGRMIDENNSKELTKVVAKNQGTKEFEQAKSFLQHLINENCTEENYGVLKSKKDLLAQVGLDYVPDIRYVLSYMTFPIPEYGLTEYKTKLYSEMLEIPKESFENLWYKYRKPLEIKR